ncbi:MAG: ion transporter [Myxococcota bacterium]
MRKFVTSCHLTPGKTSPEVMKAIRDSRYAEVQEVEERVQTLGATLASLIAAGEGAAAKEVHDEIRALEQEWKTLKTELRDSNDAYFESHLRAAEVRVLGSQRAVDIKEAFIMGLILLVLGLMLYEETNEISPQLAWLFFGIDTACCAIFLVNFYFEYRLSLAKGWYWRTHWIDFVTSIPFPPAFGSAEVIRSGRAVRLIRIVRFARLARALRVLRMVFFFWRGLDQLTSVLDVRLMKRSLVLCIGVVLLGALAINMAEGHAEPVGGGWDSVWWSFTTTVTGGFGDIHNPDSGLGRVLTVVLVIMGIILVGVFTATLTTVLMPEPIDSFDAETHEAFQELVSGQLAELAKTQAELLEEIQTLKAPKD